MITLKNVGKNGYYDYFFCPCILTMDLVDEIRTLDPRVRYYSYAEINQHRTGIRRLDLLSEKDKQEVSDFYVNAGMDEEEASTDSLDAIYTKLDPFDLYDASRQFFGDTMDSDYKRLLRERIRFEDKISYKLQLRKAG